MSASERLPSPHTVLSVRTYHLPLIGGSFGNLSFAQFNDHIPFVPKRYFIIYDVPAGVVRGAHAHRDIDQFFVCVRGSCVVTIDDGNDRDSLLLDMPTQALHVPPLIWSTLQEFSPDAMLLVLASAAYNEAEYIRDYYEFLKLKGKQ